MGQSWALFYFKSSIAFLNSFSFFYCVLPYPALLHCHFFSYTYCSTFFCLTIHLLTIFSSHPYPAYATPQPLLFCSVKGQIYWDEQSLYLPSCLNCSSQSHCEARWSRQGVERWSREGQCLHTDECTGQSFCRHIERLSRICAVNLCTSEHS